MEAVMHRKSSVSNFEDIFVYIPVKAVVTSPNAHCGENFYTVTFTDRRNVEHRRYTHKKNLIIRDNDVAFMKVVLIACNDEYTYVATPTSIANGPRGFGFVTNKVYTEIPKEETQKKCHTSRQKQKKL